MRRTPLIFLLLGTLALAARQGVVETRDGKSFDGHIRFETNLIIIVNADTLLYAQVPLTNLLTIAFAPAAPRPALAWSGGHFAGDPDHSGAGRAWGLEDTVPHPWRDDAIGAVRLPGHATFAAGLFRIHSSGAGIHSSGDAFRYVYKLIHGNTEIIARVIQVQPTDPWAKAGVMMRESLSADAPNVMLAVTAGRGGIFQWRDTRGDETKGKMRRELTVPCWLKLKREGDTFTGYKSHDGKLWGVLEKVTVPLRKDIYVGLAAVGPEGKQLHRSALDNVQEGLSIMGAAYAPQVELQSGSTVAGRIHSADDTEIRFQDRLWQAPLPLHPVANIRFQFVPARFAARLNSGRVGVLLADGDFIDGEFKGIVDGEVIVSSTVLGLHRYDTQRDVIAVILRKPAPVPADYELKTTDGSVWRGRSLQFTSEQAIMREGALGVCRVPLHELAEMRRGNE